VEDVTDYCGANTGHTGIVGHNPGVCLCPKKHKRRHLLMSREDISKVEDVTDYCGANTGHTGIPGA